MEYIKPVKLAKCFGEQGEEFLATLREKIKQNVGPDTRALTFGRFSNGVIFAACKEDGRLLFWIGNPGFGDILKAVQKGSLKLKDFVWNQVG